MAFVAVAGKERSHLLFKKSQRRALVIVRARQSGRRRQCYDVKQNLLHDGGNSYRGSVAAGSSRAAAYSVGKQRELICQKLPVGGF
jgi:hypothetical protein